MSKTYDELENSETTSVNVLSQPSAPDQGQFCAWMNAVVKNRKFVRNPRPYTVVLLLAIVCVLASGCYVLIKSQSRLSNF